MARPASGMNLSIAQLEQILRTRKTEQTKLERTRAKLVRKLSKVDAQIRALGGTAGGSNGGGGGRVRNEKSLVEMIHDVLSKSSKPVNVGEIASAVQSKGYTTKSANFRGIVNQTLIKEKQFSQAARGMYQLKK